MILDLTGLNQAPSNHLLDLIPEHFDRDAAGDTISTAQPETPHPPRSGFLTSGQHL
jgi:hypothetical protein